ncbi:MAG: CHAT domain-containing protein [Phormidium sp.]
MNNPVPPLTKDENLVPPLLRGVRGDQTQIQPLYFPPENRQQLDSDIATYLSDYRQKTWGDTLKSRLANLSESLQINQILAKLPPTIKKLILIPHCDLHLLPLHALKGRKEEEGYLIDLFPNGIQYAPSCQFLERLHQRQRQTPPNTPLFAIQNPTEDLRYTEIEVETISRQFNPNTHILKREEATKNAFNSPENLAQLSQAYYAHFSCHGSFNSQNPLNSALILAREIATPNLPENREITEDQHRYITIRDGRRFDTVTQGLTLKEIFANLNLPTCRLVTLSACETGLVNRLFTDEYIGLPSAFLYAGAINVVSSLWSVSDFSTAFLMIRFYQELDKIPNVPVALQAAQKWLKSVSRPDFLTWLENEVKMNPDQVMNLKNFIRRCFPNPEPFAEPQYWAAFCAIGL